MLCTFVYRVTGYYTGSGACLSADIGHDNAAFIDPILTSQPLEPLEEPIVPEGASEVEGACIGKIGRRSYDVTEDTYISYDDITRPPSVYYAGSMPRYIEESESDFPDDIPLFDEVAEPKETDSGHGRSSGVPSSLESSNTPSEHEMSHGLSHPELPPVAEQVTAPDEEARPVIDDSLNYRDSALPDTPVHSPAEQPEGTPDPEDWTRQPLRPPSESQHDRGDASTDSRGSPTEVLSTADQTPSTTIGSIDTNTEAAEEQCPDAASFDDNTKWVAPKTPEEEHGSPHLKSMYTSYTDADMEYPGDVSVTPGRPMQYDDQSILALSNDSKELEDLANMCGQFSVLDPDITPTAERNSELGTEDVSPSEEGAMILPDTSPDDSDNGPAVVNDDLDEPQTADTPSIVVDDENVIEIDENKDYNLVDLALDLTRTDEEQQYSGAEHTPTESYKPQIQEGEDHSETQEPRDDDDKGEDRKLHSANSETTYDQTPTEEMKFIGPDHQEEGQLEDDRLIQEEKESPNGECEQPSEINLEGDKMESKENQAPVEQQHQTRVDEAENDQEDPEQNEDRSSIKLERESSPLEEIEQSSGFDLKVQEKECTDDRTMSHQMSSEEQQREDHQQPHEPSEDDSSIRLSEEKSPVDKAERSPELEPEDPKIQSADDHTLKEIEPLEVQHERHQQQDQEGDEDSISKQEEEQATQDEQEQPSEFELEGIEKESVDDESLVEQKDIPEENEQVQNENKGSSQLKEKPALGDEYVLEAQGKASDAPIDQAHRSQAHEEEISLDDEEQQEENNTSSNVITNLQDAESNNQAVIASDGSLENTLNLMQKDESMTSLTDSDATEKQMDDDSTPQASSPPSRLMTDSGTSYDFGSSVEDDKDPIDAEYRTNVLTPAGSTCEDTVTDDLSPDDRSIVDRRDNPRQDSFGGWSAISSEGTRRLSFSDMESDNEESSSPEKLPSEAAGTGSSVYFGAEDEAQDKDLLLTTDGTSSTLSDNDGCSALISSTDNSFIGGTYEIETGKIADLVTDSMDPSRSSKATDQSFPSPISVSDEVFTDGTRSRELSPDNDTAALEPAPVSQTLLADQTHLCDSLASGMDGDDEMSITEHEITADVARNEPQVTEQPDGSTVKEPDQSDGLISAEAELSSPTSPTGYQDPELCHAEPKPLSLYDELRECGSLPDPQNDEDNHSDKSDLSDVQPVSMPTSIDPLSNLINFGHPDLFPSCADKSEPADGSEQQTDKDDSQMEPVANVTTHRRQSIVRFNNDVSVTSIIASDDEDGEVAFETVESLHDPSSSEDGDEEAPPDDAQKVQHEDDKDSSFTAMKSEEDNQPQSSQDLDSPLVTSESPPSKPASTLRLVSPEPEGDDPMSSSSSTSFEAVTDFRIEEDNLTSETLAAQIVADSIAEAVRRHAVSESPSPITDDSQRGSSNSLYDNVNGDFMTFDPNDGMIVHNELEEDDDDDEGFSLYQGRQLSAVEELSESDNSLASTGDPEGRSGFVDTILEEISSQEDVSDSGAEVEPATRHTDITGSLEEHSPDDDVDLSSVDSYNTVVNQEDEQEPTGYAEDRLGDLASMTSSMASDVLPPDTMTPPDLGELDVPCGVVGPATPTHESAASTPSSDVGVIQRFPSRVHEPDAISVTSSLAEFESLERQLKNSDSPRSSLHAERMLARNNERDDASISSSVAEFEQLETLVQDGDTPVSPHAKLLSQEAIQRGSNSSLAEFESLEDDLQSEEVEREAEKVVQQIEEISAYLSSRSADRPLTIDVNRATCSRESSVDHDSTVTQFSTQTISQEYHNVITGGIVSEDTNQDEPLLEPQDHQMVASPEYTERISVDGHTAATDTDTILDHTQSRQESERTEPLPDLDDTIQSIIDEAARNVEILRSEMTDSVILSSLDDMASRPEEPYTEEEIEPTGCCTVMSQPPNKDLMTDSHDSLGFTHAMTQSTESLTGTAAFKETQCKSSDSLVDESHADPMQQSTDSLSPDQSQQLQFSTGMTGSRPALMEQSLDSLSSEVIHEPYLKESPINIMTESMHQDMLSSTSSGAALQKSTDSFEESRQPIEGVSSPLMEASVDSLTDPQAANVMHASSDSLKPVASTGNPMEASTDSLGQQEGSGTDLIDGKSNKSDIMAASTDSLGTFPQQPNIMAASTDSLGTSPQQPNIMAASTDSLGTSPQQPNIMAASTDSLGTSPQQPNIMAASTDSLGALTTQPDVMAESTDSLGNQPGGTQQMAESTDSLGNQPGGTQQMTESTDSLDTNDEISQDDPDMMSLSFHQSYPARQNPFAADDSESDTESKASSNASSRTREQYESDYRYEPRQKVFTMADVEAEREARRTQKGDREQSPTPSTGSQAAEGSFLL